MHADIAVIKNNQEPSWGTRRLSQEEFAPIRAAFLEARTFKADFTASTSISKLTNGLLAAYREMLQVVEESSRDFIAEFPIPGSQNTCYIAFKPGEASLAAFRGMGLDSFKVQVFNNLYLYYSGLETPTKHGKNELIAGLISALKANSVLEILAKKLEKNAKLSSLFYKVAIEIPEERAKKVRYLKVLLSAFDYPLEDLNFPTCCRLLEDEYSLSKLKDNLAVVSDANCTYLRIIKELRNPDGSFKNAYNKKTLEIEHFICSILDSSGIDTSQLEVLKACSLQKKESVLKLSLPLFEGLSDLPYSIGFLIKTFYGAYIYGDPVPIYSAAMSGKDFWMSMILHVQHPDLSREVISS